MRWGSVLSLLKDAALAVDEAAAALEEALGDVTADLVLVFVSPHHLGALGAIAAFLAERFPNAVRIGGSAGGVIGAAHEAERVPALSLTGAALPGVAVRGFAFDATDLPAPEGGPEAWHSLVGVEPAEKPSFVILADPFTFDAERLLQGLDAAFPGAAIVGGLLSGSSVPGGHVALSGKTLRLTGAVGVALAGNIMVEAIVAQGCRPIGQPMLTTRCRNNELLELGGQKPRMVLEELYGSLSPRDRSLFRNALVVGIEMKDQREYQAGDFLIRNIIGLDPADDSIAIGATLKPWQVVQFHLRDAGAAHADLSRLLERHPGARSDRAPQGALLFSCLGRGTGLYGQPDHDTRLFHSRMGPVPLGGFFANGEIGPVGGQTFLHGYTSAFGLFRARVPEVL